MKNKLEYIIATVLMITFLYFTNYVVGEEQSSAQDLAQLIRGKEPPTVQELTELFTVDFTFYGQVLDQDSQPVENASVSIEVTYYDPEGELWESERTRNLVTDADGKFQLSDNGIRIFIDIEKKGYKYVDDNESFNLGSLLRPRHQPDESSPVTFTLHKKSYPAYLTGSGPSKDEVLWSKFDIAKDFETKFYITEGYYDVYGKDGLMTDGSTSIGQYGFRNGSKDIQVSGTVPIANMYEIEFTPLVANSGLILSDDRFEEAPESGYLSSVTISIPTDNRVDFKKYIYAKTADGSFYSRLDIEIMIGGRGRGQLIITSWTNPAGSRNLKYDNEYEDYEKAWRTRLYHLRKAAELKGVVARRQFLEENDLDGVIGIKSDGTFDETLFQQEADTLKVQLKTEDPRWWHVLE